MLFQTLKTRTAHLPVASVIQVDFCVTALVGFYRHDRFKRGIMGVEQILLLCLLGFCTCLVISYVKLRVELLARCQQARWSFGWRANDWLPSLLSEVNQLGVVDLYRWWLSVFE